MVLTSRQAADARHTSHVVDPGVLGVDPGGLSRRVDRGKARPRPVHIVVLRRGWGRAGGGGFVRCGAQAIEGQAKHRAISRAAVRQTLTRQPPAEQGCGRPASSPPIWWACRVSQPLLVHGHEGVGLDRQRNQADHGGHQWQQQDVPGASEGARCPGYRGLLAARQPQCRCRPVSARGGRGRGRSESLPWSPG